MRESIRRRIWSACVLFFWPIFDQHQLRAGLRSEYSSLPRVGRRRGNQWCACWTALSGWSILRLELIEKGASIMFERIATILVLLLPLAQAPAVQAQSWPLKPLRIIIHQPPGRPSDSVPRGMQVHLAPKFGQAIVIENRPGAGGVVGLEACARAAPDGYTFCVSNNGG